MDPEQRIAQFQKMATEDPENEMAHFSLGRALQDAGRYAEAARSFVECTRVAPGMSKAYELAAKCYLEDGETDHAAQIAEVGYVKAAEQGDRMPRDAMGEILDSLNRPVPQVETKAPGSAGGPPPEGSFVCSRTGRAGAKMDRPPFRGPIGEWIAEHISRETFHDGWIPQGTKVINELRLDLSRDEDEKTYDEHMREYLGIDDALFEQLTGKQPG